MTIRSPKLAEDLPTPTSPAPTDSRVADHRALDPRVGGTA